MQVTGHRLSLAVGTVLAALLVACGGAPPPEEPPPPAPPEPESVAGWRMIDLSHAYGGNTLYWPADTTGFQLDTLAEGETPGGYFYAAKQFATAEHGGTHLDAPSHFAEGGDDAASISLGRLILPGIVIDVQRGGRGRSDYLVTDDDVLAWEDEHGPVPEGSAVLIRPDGRRAGRTPSPIWATTRPERPATCTSPASAKRRRDCCSKTAAQGCSASIRPAWTTAGPPTSSSTDRRRGRRAQPGERRGFVCVAADRLSSRGAADEDRGRNGSAGPNCCDDPAGLTAVNSTSLPVWRPAHQTGATATRASARTSRSIRRPAPDPARSGWQGCRRARTRRSPAGGRSACR